MTMKRAAFEDVRENQWGQKPPWEREREERELEKRQRAQFSNVGLVAAAFMLATLAGQVGMVVYVSILDEIMGGAIDFFSSTGLMFMSAVPMYLIAFPISLALIQAVPKCREKPAEVWGFGNFLAVLVISLGIGLAGNLLGQLVEHFRPAPDISGEELEGFLKNSSV